jgi:hypothetical protein
VAIAIGFKATYKGEVREPAMPSEQVTCPPTLARQFARLPERQQLPPMSLVAATRQDLARLTAYR